MRLIEITTPGQSEPGSMGNERVLHTPQLSKTGASPSNVVQYHTQDTPFRGGDLIPQQGIQFVN